MFPLVQLNKVSVMMGRKRWEKGEGIMNKNPVAWIWRCGAGRGHGGEKGLLMGKEDT